MSNSDDEPAAGKREVETAVPAPEPAPEVPRQVQETGFVAPAAADRYEQRLREIWEATHAYSSPPAADGDTSAWDLVRGAVGGAGNLALIGAAVAELHRVRPAGGAEDAGLQGDAGTVVFLISTALEQMSAAEYPAWVTGTLAPTIARMEREVGRREEASRERVVDVALAALEPVTGTPPGARLAPVLMGYLHGDKRPPGRGIYTTAAQLSQLTIGLDDPESRLMRSFLYHYALNGMWHLLQKEDEAFDASARSLVSVAASSAASNLWQLLPGRQAGSPGAEVVRVLRWILVAAGRELAVPEAFAGEILATLGLEGSDARAKLTVVDAVGALGGPWTRDQIEMARVESAAAVTILASGAAPSQVAIRLYNAAVSLLDVGAPGSPLVAAGLRARMLLNALGLLWSLLLASDLLEALDDMEGLDCGYGFLRALSQYQDHGFELYPSWGPATELADLLGELPRQLPRDRPALVTGAAKLADAVGRQRRRESAGQRAVDADDLTGAARRAIAALRPPPSAPGSDESDAAQPEDIGSQLLDTAALLRATFEGVLDQSRWDLADTFDELVGLRARPREVFLAMYGQFTEPSGSDFGTSPPVAAGVVSPGEWQVIADAMLHDPGTLVPAILREIGKT